MKSITRSEACSDYFKKFAEQDLTGKQRLRFWFDNSIRALKTSGKVAASGKKPPMIDSFSYPLSGPPMSLRSKILLSVFVAAFTLPALAQDQKAPPVRIRGTIDTTDAATLTVTTRNGAHQTLALTGTTRYSSVVALKMSAIKKGSFIGSAGKPGANGEIEAMEVVVFPEALRGTGEGHYDWDLLPGSSMTNATVSAVVTGKTGRDLDLTYKGGTAKLKVPKDTPVVTFVPASAKDLKAGLAVFVVATPATDGTLTAARIVLEKDGVKPPM
jgi:hypothetical protein